jgi:uncharacterized phage protein (TIGR02218 family)
MKTASPELIAMLANSSSFVMADCYAFTLLNGMGLWLNTSDIPLTIEATIYPAAGSTDLLGNPLPLIERSKTRTVRGTQVDSLTVQMYLDASHKIGGVPILTLLRNGGFDGARLSVLRAFLPDWSSPVTGTVKLFIGRVSDVELTRNSATLTVKSDLELLNIQMPRHLYQPGCANSIYDAGCRVDKTSSAQNGMINGGSSTTVIKHSNPAAAGWFAQGFIRFDTGPNAGVSRTVRDSLPGQVSLSLPLPNPPTTGDTFTIWPGCDKTMATCQAKFNNLAHYRGCPFVPVPETAY